MFCFDELKADDINMMLELETRIKDSRQKMQTLWQGYTDEAVLKASIELDELLNIYQKVTVWQSINRTG